MSEGGRNGQKELPREISTDFLEFVRDWYATDEFIPLHEPRFSQKDKQFVIEVVESTFVSSVGKFVDEFEHKLAEFCGAKYAVATVNGTAALHAALVLAGVRPGELVVTQALSFVATANAISYCAAEPAFVDVDRKTLGMCPESLRRFLAETAEVQDGKCVYKPTGQRIRACVPMHTFGHPARISEIAELCSENGLVLVEDAAESLGSSRNNKHTGTDGVLGALSFNGNKVITTGGGGALITDNADLAKEAKHITTTAKRPHPWRYDHDRIAFNYRMPNINAALGCAQLEQISKLLESKRRLANAYKEWSDMREVEFIVEPTGCRSNYWLNTILLENVEQRDIFLEYTNNNGVMTRPAWTPSHKLPMFDNCPRADLSTTEELADCIVNVPSSALPL